MTAWARRWLDFPIVFGRIVMPMSVGCTLWTAYHGWVVLAGQGLGMLLDGTIGAVLGAMCLLTAVLLTSGWWARRLNWMRHGLVLTTCLLGATTATLWGEGVGIISGGYNLPWMVMCGLAWLIEARDTTSARP